MLQYALTASGATISAGIGCYPASIEDGAYTVTLPSGVTTNNIIVVTGWSKEELETSRLLEFGGYIFTADNAIVEIEAVKWAVGAGAGNRTLTVYTKQNITTNGNFKYIPAQIALQTTFIKVINSGGADGTVNGAILPEGGEAVFHGRTVRPIVVDATSTVINILNAQH